MRTFSVAALVISTPVDSSASEKAHASEQEAAQAAAPFVAAHLGAGAPQGRFGGAAGVTLSRLVRFEMRAGRASEGLQLAALASAVYRSFGLGLGYSLGPHRWDETRPIECEDFCDAREWRSAKWLNVEFSYWHVFARHLFAGPYAGFSKILNPANHSCPPVEGGCGEKGSGERRFFVGLVFGVQY